MGNRTGAHLILAVAPGQVVFDGVCRGDTGDVAGADLVDGDLGLAGLGDDPRRKERLDEGGHKRALRVPAQLQQLLDHRGQIGHAPVLVRPLAPHDVEDVRQARPGAVGLHPRPLGRLCRGLPGVGVVDVVGDDHAVVVHLHPVKDAVSVLRVLPVRDVGHGRSAPVLGGGAHPVRLHKMDAQGVGIYRRGVSPLEHGENVSALEPRHQRQLLHPVKIVHAGSVAVGLVLGPQGKLRLGAPLPLLGRFRGDAQHLPIYGALEGQADADHLRPVGVDG